MEDQRLLSEHLSKVSQEFNKELKAYVRGNLAKIGYEFDSEDVFMEFVKNRVSKVSLAQRPHEYLLYVDFTSLEEPGIQIGSVNTRVSFKDDRNYFEIKIGSDID